MLKISDWVRKIIFADQETLEYLQKGLLNTSEYARVIKPEIETKSLQKVSHGSIVTSLSRIKDEIGDREIALKKFRIDSLEVKLPVTELVYESRSDTYRVLASLYACLQREDKALFNVINTGFEVDIFVSDSLLKRVMDSFGKHVLIETKPGLSAIMLSFDPVFRAYPGMVAQVLMLLARNKINILECTSTYSEIIIYIDQDSSDQAVDLILQNFVRLKDH